MKRLSFVLFMALSVLSVVAKEAYAVYDSSTLTFYYDDLRASRTESTFNLNTGDADPAWLSMTDIASVEFNPSFADARPTSTHAWFSNMLSLASITGLKYLNTSEVTDMAKMFYNCQRLTTLELDSFNTAKVTDMSAMFSYCANLTSIDVSGFNTESVTDMTGMFSYCEKLKTLDLSSFNTANVTSMVDLFRYCHGLTRLDLSHFNTVQVNDMSRMFSMCSRLNSLDVSGFNTRKVTNMSEMFRNCMSLTSLDLSSFNTSNVTTMFGMFKDCEKLTELNLSGFNTEKVRTMERMFEDCAVLPTLDLSVFNTANVVNMRLMFQGCLELKTIIGGHQWNTENVIESSDMFVNCNKLQGGAGTRVDYNYVDKTYARFDGGVNNPGYFTDKDFICHDGLWYRIEDDDSNALRLVAPQHGASYTGEAVIPEHFDYNGTTWTVTCIDEGAFSGTELVSVVVPATIVHIYRQAFYNAKQLKTMVMGYREQPSTLHVEDNWVGNNAYRFTCYVNNGFIDTYENLFSGVRFSPWIQFPDTDNPKGHYMTFSCKYKVELPDPLEAYYVKDYDYDQVKDVRKAVTEKVDGVLPANTGFLLKGFDSKIYLLERSRYTPIDTDDNMLVPYKTGDTPWDIQDENARFYFDETIREWTATTNVFNNGSYLCIPKDKIGSDLISPICLDLELSDLIGDVNSNGRLDIDDLNIIINIMLLKDDARKYHGQADLDSNGIVDVDDLNAFLNYILGKW